VGERRKERWARQRATMLAREEELWASGLSRIAGVDEVGVGPLAGPLVAAAVVLPRGVAIDGVHDSKKVSPKRRELLAQQIAEVALACSLGVVAVEEVDRLNTYHASLEAMRRAVVGLGVDAEHILVDARTIPGVATPQTSIVRGDASVYSIAAASIVAKVGRDHMMQELAQRHPGYGFARNAGYGTAEHLAALAEQGACAAHRRSFAPVRAALAQHEL
jgi:ribonuclease HII